MGNIKLINRFRPMIQHPKRRLFEFWSDFMCEWGRGDQEEIVDERFPVLVQEGKVRRSLSFKYSMHCSLSCRS